MYNKQSKTRQSNQAPSTPARHTPHPPMRVQRAFGPPRGAAGVHYQRTAVQVAGFAAPPAARRPAVDRRRTGALCFASHRFWRCRRPCAIRGMHTAQGLPGDEARLQCVQLGAVLRRQGAQLGFCCSRCYDGGYAGVLQDVIELSRRVRCSQRYLEKAAASDIRVGVLVKGSARQRPHWSINAALLCRQGRP